MTTVATDQPFWFRAQIQIWGCAVEGNALELSAMCAERGEARWDAQAVELETHLISHGDEPYRRVKDWAALPWLAEHILRGHGTWPGL